MYSTNYIQLAVGYKDETDTALRELTIRYIITTCTIRSEKLQKAFGKGNILFYLEYVTEPLIPDLHSLHGRKFLPRIYNSTETP